ncbi:MAG: metalloregulator ArsR/SmtB family transcription factor [Anaerolineaceae bacterium]|nr:metalloregulator ArsR/SmtB family transcription factor [Anaerolineaceae bacterium]
METTDLNREITLLHQRICPALGDPTRMLILYALKEKPRKVSELTEILGIPQPSVSRHLGILRNRNLVIAERQGTSVSYSLGFTKLIDVMDILRLILRDQMQDQTRLAEELNPSQALEANQ